MGIEKTRIRQAAYTDVGRKMEDLRDAAELETAKHRGAATALKQLSAHIRQASTAEHIEADLQEYMKKLQQREQEVAEAENREPQSVSMGVIDTIKFGLILVNRAVDQTESAAISEKNKALLSEGQLQALTTVITSVKKDVDVAQAQIDKKLLTDEEGDPLHDPDSDVPRPSGVRPISIKERRLAADAEPAPEELTAEKDAPAEPAPEPSADEPKEAAPAKTKSVSVPKTKSPTEVTEVAPLATGKKKSPKKKSKGRLESKFKDNGVRK